MSMLKNPEPRAPVRCRLIVGATVVVACGASYAQEKPHFGQPATSEEISAWDITAEPDGEGLPPGSGTARQGAAVYAAQCRSCHGEKGAGGPATRLAGVQGTIGAKTARVRTIGTFWPYATTIFNYVFTAMPFQNTKSLTHEETYAVTAYLLYLNGVIGEDDVMNADTLPKVKMPNHDYFVQHVTE
ncbi:MAG TPA: cytochrome c [Xanthobacteraceae bacterium]|nr:cytochrome c [Xanthobacteraceae bacterium]